MKYSVIDQWNAMKRLGKKKYIWLNWVLIFGVGLPFFSVFFRLIGHDYTTWQSLAKLFAVRFAAFSILGYLAGLASWSNVEKRAKLEERREAFDNAEVKFCYFCGSDLTEGSDTCQNCGRKLKE